MGMDMVTEIIAFVATPHALAAVSIIVNIVLWRALQAESLAKDKLYERYVETVTEIIGDYHDFAHTIDEYVDVARKSEDRTAPPDVD